MQPTQNDVSESSTSLRELYQERRHQYGSFQSRLQNRMVERATEFAAGREGFAFVADERRVLEYLALALAAAGDRSAVDELNIPY